MKTSELTDADRAQALEWYVKGFDLITIAQHFGVHVEVLKNLLRTKEKASD